MGNSIYRRIDGDKFERLDVIQVIDESKLREKLSRLKACLDVPKPSDEELIEAGKTIHPFYEERERVERDIQTIQKQLDILATVD